MDLLRMDYINSLPQPFLMRQWDGYEWELGDIDVETGMLRFNVCGMMQSSHISEVKMFIDSSGVEHAPDTFYSDYEEENTNV